MWYKMTLEQFLALMQNPWFKACFLIVAIWTLIWKGIALWKASRNGQKIWFAALLCINTIGILEIIYIFCCSKKKNLPMNPA